MSGHRPREIQGWTTGATIMQLLSNCCLTGVQTEHVCVQSRFSRLFQLSASQWTVAHQIPLSMRFSRQEYAVGCQPLLQGTFLTQGSNQCFLCLVHWQAGFFTTSSIWKPPVSTPGPPTFPETLKYRTYLNAKSPYF